MTCRSHGVENCGHWLCINFGMSLEPVKRGTVPKVCPSCENLFVGIVHCPLCGTMGKKIDTENEDER